ncbi:MAG: SCO family protein [Betaproteobacteria bacterium]|nr:SCO family protein [Betaproteobacteria bacterium]
MIIRQWIRLCLLLPVFWIVTAHADSNTQTLPADSVYQTVLSLRDQNGQAFTLASLRGHPVLISLFYASCQSACPLNIQAIQHIRAAVKVRTHHSAPPVILISFDPDHDTVPALSMVATMHQLTAPVWRLARPEHGDVRAFAATLGVSYRKRPNGDFSHNIEIALLDADGRLVAETSEVNAPDPTFVAAIIHAMRPEKDH